MFNSKEYHHKYYQLHKDLIKAEAQRAYEKRRINQPLKRQRYRIDNGKEQKEFYTYKELSAYLGYGEIWIYKCIKSGRAIEGYKITKVFYD